MSEKADSGISGWKKIEKSDVCIVLETLTGLRRYVELVFLYCLGKPASSTIFYITYFSYI